MKGWAPELDRLRADIRAGTPVIGIEPSCTAAFRDELPNLFPTDLDADRLRNQTFTLAEFLEGEAKDWTPPRLERTAVAHGHCHQRSIMGTDPGRRIMERMGLDVHVPPASCCGMAGAFGFEAEHDDISVQIGEHALLPAVRDADPDALIIADGFSCREQIRQLTDRRPLHLAEVLRMARSPG